MTRIRSSKDRQGYLLLGAIVAIALGAFVFKVQNDRAPRPGNDGCFQDVKENTVLVIDNSDEESEQTLSETAARALDAVRNTTTYARVSVFSIQKEARVSLHPLFAQCIPPTSGNELTENPRLIAKHFKEVFWEPLQRVIGQIPAGSSESPIAQVITDLSLSKYLRGPKNRLIVFSDLLENTPSFSLYGCTSGSWAVGAFRASRRGSMERPTFNNTSIQLNLIPRKLPAETVACRAYFWNWFFGDSHGNGAALSVDQLPGGVQ